MREIPESVDSTFRYVLLVAHRAEQLMRGALPKLEGPKRVTRLATHEIDHGAVEWDYGPAPLPEGAEAEEAESLEESPAQ